jgi:hypothetical protein
MHSQALIINERESSDIKVVWNWFRHERFFEVVVIDKTTQPSSTHVVGTEDPRHAKEVFDHPMAFV